MENHLYFFNRIQNAKPLNQIDSGVMQSNPILICIFVTEQYKKHRAFYMQ